MTGLLVLDKTTMDDLSLIGVSPGQLATHACSLLEHNCSVGGKREKFIFPKCMKIGLNSEKRKYTIRI